MAADPARFLREVRAEAAKVTWPSRQETMVMTGSVIAMVVVAAIFFFVVDWCMSFAVRQLFGIGV